MDEHERMRAGLHPQDHRAQRAAAEADEQKAGMRDALCAPSRLYTHGGIVTPLDPKSGRPAAPKPVTRRQEGSAAAARVPSSTGRTNGGAVPQAAPSHPALAPSPAGRHADAMRPVQRAATSGSLRKTDEAGALAEMRKAHATPLASVTSAGKVIPFAPLRKTEPATPVRQPARTPSPPPLRPAAVVQKVATSELRKHGTGLGLDLQYAMTMNAADRLLKTGR